ncbi:MAG: hypothetical protein LBU17_01635, partial [Treponema sp.]|nr:hypothetical protein [Treponema sp.]
PKQCECGAILDIHGHCHACGKAREFDTAKGRYVFTQTIKNAIPNGTLLRILQKRAVPDEVLCERLAQ